MTGPLFLTPREKEELAERILCAPHHPLLVAIDGRAGAGKTTLAGELHRQVGGTLVHMDDYFLPLPMKTPERLGEPGDNIHWERFLEELLLPLSRGQEGLLRPFNCHTQSILPGKPVPPTSPILVEGSYALHPALREMYQLRIFLALSQETQRERLTARNASLYPRYEKEWIPLEEAYFKETEVEKDCHMILTSDPRIKLNQV